MPDDPLEALIEDLYDLATGGPGEAEWESLLGRMAGLAGASSAVIQLVDPAQGQTQLMATHNISEVAGREYTEHFFSRDIFFDCLNLLTPGQLMFSQDLIPDQAVEQSEIYNDLFRRRMDNAFYVAGGAGMLEDGRRVSFGMPRARERGGFTPQEMQSMQRLWPHLRRAVQVHLRLQQAQATQRLGFEALDRLTGGVVILAADRRIVFMNRAAQRLVEQRGGCAAVGIGSRLRLAYGPADERLSLLLAQATAIGQLRRSNTLRCPRAEGLPPLALLVAPFQPNTPLAVAGATPLALLLLSDPQDSPPPLPDQLMSIYGLTRAEAGVAASLAQGLSPEEVAQARQVRLSTVRSQVQALLAKTGTRRQGELLRLLLSLPQAVPPE